MKRTRPNQVDEIDSNWTLYNRQFPFFREPKEIGAFNFENCYFDLKLGYEKMIKKDESIKSYVTDLLKWAMLHREKFTVPTPALTAQVAEVEAEDEEEANSSTSTKTSKTTKHLFNSLNTDFVCWRGLLTRILCIPYEKREDLRIAVIRARGTYFMCQYETEAKQEREERMTERDKEMCAWGWKFEQYVTADKVHGTPDTQKPVNNNEEYGVVVRSRLGSHSLVYGAEVDCTDPETDNYLELKTSRMIESQRQHENFCRFKLIKFWAQSFLIGIKRIVCGFRDDKGIVRLLENFQVKDIPKLSSSAIKNGWNASVCFNFLDSFLSFVKATIPNDDERCAYVFYWKPGGPMALEGKGDEAFHFLPDWFLNSELWDSPV